jgi:site-specific DNA-methyltransferase (adenine-specific)
MACAIEDAGFEIRDTLAWMYGSGFPKSLDVSKAIDRANGDERPVVGVWSAPGRGTKVTIWLPAPPRLPTAGARTPQRVQ